MFCMQSLYDIDLGFHIDFFIFTYNRMDYSRLNAIHKANLFVIGLYKVKLLIIIII